MGASIFSGQFSKDPGYFDGEAQEARASKTKAKPDLYNLLLECAQRQHQFGKSAADGAAATATAETPFALIGAYAKSIRSAQLVPAAALTADNTNYATIIVRARKSDGTLIGKVAQVTTQITGSGNWTQWKVVTIPLTDGTNALAVDAAGLDLPAGAFLTYEITKTGTGVVVPALVGSLMVL